MAPGTQKKRYEGAERRILHLGLGLVAVFAILIGRAWQLQVIHGHQYRNMAEEQRLHPQRLKAPRGIILGNDDVILGRQPARLRHHACARGMR